MYFRFRGAILDFFFKGFYSFICHNNEFGYESKRKEINADHDKQHDKIEYGSESSLKKDPGNNFPYSYENSQAY